MSNLHIRTKYLSPSDFENTEALFKLFSKQKLYTPQGVFREVWDVGHYDSKAPQYVGYVSYASINDKPIGVSYLPKHDYYTYDRELYGKPLKYLGYGFVGVYVKESYRNKGLGKTLLNNVLSKSRAPLVWIESSIAHMVETPTKLIKVNKDYSLDIPEELL